MQKLRKKLKSKDWPRIYQYARANGFDKFDVYLNDTLIPWQKVWKEIRRSGVTRSKSSRMVFLTLTRCMLIAGSEPTYHSPRRRHDPNAVRSTLTSTTQLTPGIRPFPHV